MTPGDVLRMVVASLDDGGIPHMIVGSLASSAHGEPRSTNDIDMVIDPTAESLPRFEATLVSQDFYVGPDPLDALTHRDMFNAIHPSSGWKIDLIILKDRPFDRAQFRRRRQERVFDTVVWMATPEDTVLAKLEWARKSGSERQVRDAAAVLEVRRAVIDNDYLDRWAPELGVVELLAQARAVAADGERDGDS